MPETESPSWSEGRVKVTKKDLSYLPGYDPYRDAKGYHYDHQAGIDAVRFIEEYCRHSKGEWAGKLIRLTPWQLSFVLNLFGWKNKKGYRRYREALLYIARKNGKTLLAAAIACYLAYADGEPGAEIMTCAAEKEQASLCWHMAKAMVQQEPRLDGVSKIYTAQKSITAFGDTVFIKPVSADADTKHGASVHGAIMDELHCHKNGLLYEAMETATGSRRNPLILGLTTADHDRPSLCNTKLKYAKEVRDGIIEDPRFLPAVFEASREDDWTVEETWRKANPNLGITPSLEFMQDQCKKAQNEPTFENSFKRLHLNIVTEQAMRWLQLHMWDKCGTPFDPAELEGCRALAAFDLSSTNDLTSFGLFFPEQDMKYLPFFWIPEDSAIEREKRDRVPYLTWIKEGLIKTTPGNSIDYDFIVRDIMEACKLYDVSEIAYDPWNARGTATTLADLYGMEMVEYRQGFVSMNEPCKEIERMVIARELNHGGNKVLRWNAANVAVKEDPSGNIKIDKQRSSEKVDGMVCLAMCVGRHLVTRAGPDLDISDFMMRLD